VIVRTISAADVGADAMTREDSSIRTMPRMIQSIEAGEAVSLARPSQLGGLSDEKEAGSAKERALKQRFRAAPD
jgi:hypothetical protein